MKFEVPAACVGLRLDKALSHDQTISTRSRAEKLIAQGRVTLNGLVLRSSYKCRTGDVYHIDWPLPVSSELTPWDFKLDVVFEDNELLVIEKPSGLVVHPSHGHSEHTLVHALLFHTKNLSMGFNELRPGIVHRLDKDTSGLLVIAKTDHAHKALAEQFKAHTVKRRYWAIVHSTPRLASGVITTFLNRHPSDRKKYASSTKGKKAVTHYRVLKTHGAFSLLECRLETGRTHQIRVHLSEMGHPLVGDVIYGRKEKFKSRLGLHAFELGFEHPLSGEGMNFKSQWPKDLEQWEQFHV